jgi:hypothetical protein
MEKFVYELRFDEELRAEVNVLLALDLATALDFFDQFFLELHNTRESTPSTLRLLTQDTEEDLADYAMHFARSH